MTRTTLEQLQARFKAAEAQLSQKAIQLRAMQGRPDYTDQMAHFKNDMQKLSQFKTFLWSAQKAFQARQAAAAGDNQAHNNGQGQQQQIQQQPLTVMASESGPSTSSAHPPVPTPMSAAAQQPQPKLPMQQLPTNVNPQIAVQMQKMLEQRNRTPRMPSANLGAPVPEPVAGPSMGMVNVNPTPPAPAPAQKGPFWRGYLKWSGTESGTNIRREMFTQVLMQAPFHNNIPDNMCVISVCIA